MHNTPEGRRDQIPELYVVRALAMLGVLVIHVTARPVVQLSPASALYPAYVLVNRLGALGVPAFVFLSGLVLFYNYHHRPLDAELLRRFYSRRALSVVLPYLVWSVLYYLLSLFQAYGWQAGARAFSGPALARGLAYGTAYYHLYFVVISIQFYLVFPLVLWLLKRWPSASWRMVAGGMALQLAFVCLNRYLLNLPFKGSIALSYVSYYLLGAYAALQYDRFVNIMEGRKFRALGWPPVQWGHVLTTLWAFAGLGYAALYYRGYGFDVWYDALWYELAWTVYTFLSIFVLVGWARQIRRAWRSGLVRAIAGFGAASYGVFLIHPVFVALWERYTATPTPGPAVYHMSMALGIVVIAALSWGIVAAVTRHVPLSWVLFGARQSPERR